MAVNRYKGKLSFSTWITEWITFIEKAWVVVLLMYFDMELLLRNRCLTSQNFGPLRCFQCLKVKICTKSVWFSVWSKDAENITTNDMVARWVFILKVLNSPWILPLPKTVTAGVLVFCLERVFWKQLIKWQKLKNNQRAFVRCTSIWF